MAQILFRTNSSQTLGINLCKTIGEHLDVSGAGSQRSGCVSHRSTAQEIAPREARSYRETRRMIAGQLPPCGACGRLKRCGGDRYKTQDKRLLKVERDLCLQRLWTRIYLTVANTFWAAALCLALLARFPIPTIVLVRPANAGRLQRLIVSSIPVRAAIAGSRCAIPAERFGW